MKQWSEHTKNWAGLFVTIIFFETKFVCMYMYNESKSTKTIQIIL